MNTRSVGLSTKLYVSLIRIGFALAIAFLLTRIQFEYIEGLFFDARVRLKPTSATSGLIQTVSVDPRTVEKLNRIPSVSDHSQVLRVLKQAGARVVIYLFNPNELVGTEQDRYELSDIAHAFSRFYVAVNDVALKGDKEAFRLVPPFDGLEIGYAPITADANIFARDNVTRRMMLSYQGQPMMHLLVAQLFNPQLKDEKNARGVFDFLNSNQAYIDIRPTGTYPTTSFIDLEANVQPLERFKDKVVIIGRDTQTTTKDYVLTPFSRDIVAMTAVELNANMLDTLILNSAPVRAPNWINVMFTALISVLTIYVVLSLKPTQGLLILGGTILGFFALGFLFFWWGGVWIGMAHPFLAVFICYYFFIPYRLIVENRRSWEYYQKNRLLTQVEELKTNFLSMMSHDLKTPIARIQGMTDVVLHDSNPLSSRQKEALQTLSRSSEELLEFVSSILNLGRIESKELKLHMKSRDPNSLLEEVIEKYQYLAKTKSIEVSAELEPLFSVKMDVDLMRQVFSNLLENAIKYSPENSRILVTSEEQSGKVVIQFADQGQGIPEDELPHVFMKFYRSKNAKASPTKGSGLGLYLAKYFVELHKGSISVDSRLGEGSTFTVELPTTASED
jgi:hypothetical protein